MRERHMPSSDAVYRPLKSFVAKRGGVRLAMHGGLRDRIVEMIVEEWPIGCPADRLEEVVKARVSVRLRKKYGSVVAMFLLSMLAQALVKIIIEWWFSRESHRVLMVGWANAAQSSPI
jgi:hypothetical protein